MLLRLANWIELFAKGYRRNVTLQDFERLVACMPPGPPGQSEKAYKQNIEKLFWHGSTASQRAEGFLSLLPPPAYDEAYKIVRSNHPDHRWNLKAIMSQIHDKGIVCKSVMLNVGFWFNPDLEEPANRANVKPPMIYHLKPTFSRFDPMHPEYEDDESWKEPALALQRVVLKFTLDAWPRGNEVIGNLGQLRDMNPQKFSDYINTPFWISLLREIRNSVSVPFSHPALTRYKTISDLPPDPQRRNPLPNDSVLRGQVGNLVRDEYSDGQTLESADEEDIQKDGNDSTFASQYVGRNSSQYQPDSIQPEPLAVESEEEREDIIHVQTPSPSYSNRSKKRKAQHMKEEYNNEKSQYGQYDPPQTSLQRIVKLKLPGLFPATNPAVQGLVAETRSSPRKRPVSSGFQPPATVQEPSPTISAPSRTTPVLNNSFTAEPQRRNQSRPSWEQHTSSEDANMTDAGGAAAEPVERTLPWQHVDLETARRALEESQRSSVSATRDSEEMRRHSVQPAHRPRQHNLPLTSNNVSSRPATPMSTPQPAPQSAPQPLYHPPTSYAHTPVAPSPAPQRTKIEQAIGALQDEYGERLRIEDMLSSIKILKNDVEAGIFLTLKPGTLRDAWLLESIRIS